MFAQFLAQATQNRGMPDVQLNNLLEANGLKVAYDQCLCGSPLPPVSCLPNLAKVLQADLGKMAQAYCEDHRAGKRIYLLSMDEADATAAGIQPLGYGPKWNPLLTVDPFVFAETFAEISGNEGLPLTVLARGIIVLRRLDNDNMEHGKYLNLLFLKWLIENVGDRGRDIVNNFSRINAPTISEARENMDIAMWFLNSYFPEGSEEYRRYASSHEAYLLDKITLNPSLRDFFIPDPGLGERSGVERSFLPNIFAVPLGADVDWMSSVINDLLSMPDGVLGPFALRTNT